jgi:hypothetical protein
LSPKPPPLPQDDGLVEQQFHDLLKFLMDWLYREKCDLLRSYHVWSHHEGAFDPEFMLTNVEIYLSETLKLRSIALFESWLADWSSAKFEHSSAKYEYVRHFSIEDKPARFICILKYLHSSRQLGSQLRLFRDRRTADSSARPACSASPPSSNASLRRHRCLDCEVKSPHPPPPLRFDLARHFVIFVVTFCSYYLKPKRIWNSIILRRTQRKTLDEMIARMCLFRTNTAQTLDRFQAKSPHINLQKSPRL